MYSLSINFFAYLRLQAKEDIKKYVDERFPEEYEKCLVGLTAVSKETWNTAQSTEDKREKIEALSLVKECYSMKLDTPLYFLPITYHTHFYVSLLKSRSQRNLSNNHHLFVFMKYQVSCFLK
jgi:hypothetical protein